MKKICVCFLCGFFFFQQALWADTNYKQVALNLLNAPNRVLQFFAEVSTTTYDLQQNARHTYQQEILWVRNEFLSTKIFDEQNQLAYLIYNNENTQTKFVKKLSFDDIFFELDIESWFVGFFSKTEQKLFNFYESLGINYFYTSLVEENNNYYYRLGNDSAYIFLNKENYRTEKFVRYVYYNGEKLELVAIFQDWHLQKNKMPQTIKYYLNGNLFKRDDIVYLQFRGLKNRIQTDTANYE